MERDKNTLWWNVYTPNNIAQKRVVRSWCNRRLRNAFKEALAARGFDKEGRSIEWPGIQNLRGSVDMQSSKELITAKYDDLKHQAGLSVEAIFRIQSKGPALEKAGGPRVTQRYHERGSMGASM